MNAPLAQRIPFPPGLRDTLAAMLGERFTTAAAPCGHHGHDESHFPDAVPDAVAFPESTEEVSAIVRACAAHGVPLIPFGAGSSLEGHVLAVRGGLSMDFTRMNRVLAVNVEDLDCRVEPGVTRKQLNAVLHGSGLFFPIDPGADASLGGMCATRASGTNAVRYGTMREVVLGLTVVLADGSVIRTGGRARKSSAGYDLTRLFVGSEGTLGIMTEITLRLSPVPEAVAAAVCAFPTVDDAVQTVIQTIQMGVPIARIELLDAMMVRATNAYSKTTLREAPMLFFEFHGSPASVKEQAQTVQELAAGNGGLDFEWAEQPEDRSRLWAARHSALFATIALRPGARALTTDVCVPISCLADCIAATEQDLATTGLVRTIVGHVGDGNFHVVLLVDPEDEDEIERAEAASRRIVQHALDMGGTCTGEHGIGIGKQDFLVAEHGPAVDVMRTIKRALDPANLLNPGKVVPGL
ncbi:MAG: FAD-binding protein [Rhodocyclaceae bacterium]|nr:FAD-binding protein [Rhodocyclaceae bacterium]MBX3669471.1 FAD-binding protein [Rhodocyclaceae bacterium]